MSRSLPDRVAGLYYAHGLFCSSHPVIVLSLAISVLLFCCYPLVNLPMPGNAPKTVINNTIAPANGTETSVLYVQQVVLRIGVMPWNEDLTLMDAFRGPLYEVFNLLEIIQNYQHPETFKTLGQVCLHIEAAKRRNGKKAEVLPEYNCLVLSPANLWQQSMELFAQDTNLINTIFSYQNLQRGKISLAEVMFGMSLKETGVKRYPARIRQRVLQYAVTIYLKKYDEQFIQGLQHRLKTYYHLHQNVDNSTNVDTPDEILNIFYPGEFNYSEFFPLMMTLLALFFYEYFQVRKIELVKSKLGIAFSATVTVLGSLSMTVGVCFFFGLTLSMSAKEVFPYLVIIFGLENVQVLTKSVVSTPAHLDVKIRVAQALSKEGWSITKNLLTEVTILTIGLFTFVPAIQEFCIFAIVGLLSDFFLQMVFFSTILALDIRRTELSSENSKFHLSHIPTSRRQQFTTTITNRKPHIFRSKSHPRLNGLATGPTNVIAPNTQNTHTLGKIPKRLRLVHFWARTRIFQRAFMVWMVVWISMTINNYGIIEHVIHLSETLKPEPDDGYTIDKPQPMNYVELNTVTPISVSPATIAPDNLNEQDVTNNTTEELNKLRPMDFPPWNSLSLYHWSSILSMYNVSIAGGRVTILPTIKLSHAMNPQLVKKISNPNDVQHFQWQSLATAALDPLDFSDMEVRSRSEGRVFNTDAPFVPSSPMEIFLAAVLCLISVIVVAYTMVVLYRCICSRNYAEWRASWNKQEKTHDSVTQLVLEAVPLVLEGHTQEVECIATDGNTVASTCLAGHIRIWDSTSGEQLAHIDRRQFFTSPQKNLSQTSPDADELMSDYESGSPPSRGEMEAAQSMGLYSPASAMYQGKLSPAYNAQRINNNHKRRSIGNTLDYDYQITELGNDTKQRLLLRRSLDSAYDLPDLKSAINTKFSAIKYTPLQRSYDQGFDFGERYKILLEEHNKSIEEMQKSETREQSNIPPARLNNSVGSTTSINTDRTMQSSHIASAIWCMDYQENLIVVGCANGSLEFWEGTTGRFKCLFDDGSGLGISAVKLVGSRVVAAKLNGTIDFLQLESYSEGQQIDWGFTSFAKMTVRLEISFYVRSCSDIASLTACLGTTLGYLIILMPAVEGDDPEIKVTTEELTWISSLDLVLIAIGCLVSGSMSQYLGRKKAMILSNIPFVIAWVIFYYSTNSAMLFVALTINGLTGGLLEAPVLTYGAEVTQPNLRGMLSATSTMSLMFGTFTQILSGRWAHWRMVAMINLFYPIVCFIALCLVPESPYWLAAKGRFAESEQALCWLRGWTSPSQVQDEFQIICETVRKSADNASSNKKEIWRSYTKRTFYLPFILMIVIMLIYSFGGAMSTQTFAVHLFERYDTPINKYTATVFLGIAQLLGTLVCIMVIRFLGKRKLTFLSLSCTSLCFLAIAIYGFLNEADYIDKVKYTWIPTALLIFLAFVLNFGIRSLPWILVGEIYPLDVRSGATAASVLLGYILMAIANKIFLNMVDGMTLSGTFLFYSVINLVGICFLYIMLPETENRTFKEIEEHFAGVQNLKNRPKKKQHVIDETSAVVNPAFLHDENIENKL